MAWLVPSALHLQKPKPDPPGLFLSLFHPISNLFFSPPLSTSNLFTWFDISLRSPRIYLSIPPTMTTPAPDAAPKRAPSPRVKPHITDTPITVSNWHQHVNWLNVTFIAGIPIIGCLSAAWTPLKWQTALWAVVYYFCTGLGRSLFRNLERISFLTKFNRYHCWLP